jgi:hypothetical protein
VSAALTTLPWVEPDSIKTDAKARQAQFTVKDRTKFNLDEVKKALGSRYSDGVKVLTEPTEK